MIETKPSEEISYAPPYQQDKFGATSVSEGEAFSLIAAATTLLRNWKPLVVWPFVLGVLAVSITFLFSPTYTASASFVPQQVDASTLSSLSGLAAQFGVSVPQANAAQSPAFYADLVSSRPIVEAIVDSKYLVRVDTGMATAELQRFLDINEAMPTKRREKAIREMRRHIFADFDQRTGVIEFSIRTAWPELSYQIAQRMLALINDFNLRTRQAQAEAQRDFSESRLQAARDELRRAEDELERFMLRNRSFAGDPQLNFQHDRLARDLQLKQQLYLSMAQAFEQSRLEALRNTPVIAVLSHPELPVIPDRRYLLVKGVAAAAFGFFVVAGLAMARRALRSNALNSGEISELREAVAEARADITGLLRRLRPGRLRDGG